MPKKLYTYFLRVDPLSGIAGLTKTPPRRGRGELIVQLNLTVQIPDEIARTLDLGITVPGVVVDEILAEQMDAALVGPDGLPVH